MIGNIRNSDNDMVFWVAASIAVICGGLFGLAMNEGVYSPLRKRKIGLVSQMVVSVGLAIALHFFRLESPRPQVRHRRRQSDARRSAAT